MDTARIPGTDHRTNVPKRPFSGKRRLINAVDVRSGGTFSIQTFDAGELVLRPGDPVVVDSAKGTVVGKVAGLPSRRILPANEVRRVIRRATQMDVDRAIENGALAREGMKACVRLIHRFNLPMKLVQVEYLLDRSKAIFYFTSDERVDFRRLVRALASDLGIRVEMRQIGVRDGAGVIGGLGPCGNELCCSSFLKKFSSVSIRYAKQQSISLNPQKIAGMCGRLKCCLVYESPVYKEMKKYAPRRRMGAHTPLGPANILDVDTINRKVKVVMATGAQEHFHIRDIIVLDRAFTREEMDAATSREAEVMARRKARRGMSTESLGGMSREAASVLEEEYLWTDTAPEVSQAEAPRKQDEGAPTKKRRRRRRNKKSNTGADSQAATQPASSSPAGDDPGHKSSRSRRSRSKKRGGGEEQGQSKGPTDSQKTTVEAAGDGETRSSKSRSRRRRRRKKTSGGGGGGSQGGGTSGQSGGGEASGGGS